MKSLHHIAFALVVTGAVNIGLIALVNFDAITFFLQSLPSVMKVFNVLIGISAVYLVVTHKGNHKK